MALAFVLPAAQDCNQRIVAPVDVAMQKPMSFIGIAPTYAAAALLAMAIVLTYLRRRTTIVPAAVGVSLLLVTSAAIVVSGFDRHADELVTYVPVLPAILIALAAPRRFGLARLALLIDSYTLAAFPVVALNVAVGRYYGAYLFLAGYAVLVVIRVIRFGAGLREALRGRALERRPAR